MAAPFRLKLEEGDSGLVDDLIAAGATRIDLGALLSRDSRDSRRVRRTWVRGSAAHHAFRFSLRDTFDATWWPQGIDVDPSRGMLAVSWFARDSATRLTFVDLARRRYRHVQLVDPVQDAEGHVTLDPIVVHAGGIAWLGDRILVADTFGGLREFRLADLLLHDGEAVLPQAARYRARKADDRGMRFSFVSIEHADGDPRLVAGEYGDGSRADRAARFTLDGEVELHEPGLFRMQGIVIVDGVWHVTTSNGEWTPGDLWVGAPGAFTRHRHVLPPGPEDLAYDRTSNTMWSLSEWPGRRRVFQVKLSG